MQFEKRFTITDLYLACYLQINGIIPELQSHNGRVIFSFPVTDELYKLVNGYNTGAKASVLDYTTALKTLRARMLSAKAGAVR